MTGIVNNNNSKLYSIYANPEHVHMLASRTPKLSGEFLATVIAESSTKFINDNRLSKGEFSWQESGSAFSISKSDVDKVCKYILNQPEHHRKVSFAEEYNKLVKFRCVETYLPARRHAPGHSTFLRTRTKAEGAKIYCGCF
jgi:putative transposase